MEHKEKERKYAEQHIVDIQEKEEMNHGYSDSEYISYKNTETQV